MEIDSNGKADAGGSMAGFQVGSAMREESSFEVNEKPKEKRTVTVQFGENSSNLRQDTLRAIQAKQQSERFLGLSVDDDDLRLAYAEATFKSTLVWFFVVSLVFVIVVVLVWHYGLVVLK